MDSLFEFDKKYNIIPNPEVLIFPCFKKLWDRDTSKDKNKAITELGYIWYMCNKTIKKNIYYEKFVDNDEEKSKAIIKDLFTFSWKPDKLINECIEFYNKNNYKESVDTRDALMSAKTNLKRWFKEYNPDVDMDGLQLQRNTKSIQELTKAIKEYQELILTEEEHDDSRITGGGEIGAFED